MSTPEIKLNKTNGLPRKHPCVSIIGPKEERRRVRSERQIKRRKKFLLTYPDIGSIEDLFRPYSERLYEGSKDPLTIAVEAARILSKSNEPARKVLHKWDSWSEENKSFLHEFDFCVCECKVDLTEFKRALLDTMNGVAKMKAQSVMAAGLPSLVSKAMTIAGDSERDKGNRVLQRVMEKENLLDKPPGQIAVNVNAGQTMNMPIVGQLPSADEFSLALDKVLSARERARLPEHVDAPEFETIENENG